MAQRNLSFAKSDFFASSVAGLEQYPELVSVGCKDEDAELLAMLDKQLRSGRKAQSYFESKPNAGYYALHEALASDKGAQAPPPKALQIFVYAPDPANGNKSVNSGPSRWSCFFENAPALPEFDMADLRQADRCTLLQVSMAALHLRKKSLDDFQLVFLRESMAQKGLYTLVPAFRAPNVKLDNSRVLFLTCKDLSDRSHHFGSISWSASTVDWAAEAAGFDADPAASFPVVLQGTPGKPRNVVQRPPGFLPAPKTACYLRGELRAHPDLKVPQVIKTPVTFSEIADRLGVEDASLIRHKANSGRKVIGRDQALVRYLGDALNIPTPQQPQQQPPPQQSQQSQEPQSQSDPAPLWQPKLVGRAASLPATHRPAGSLKRSREEELPERWEDAAGGEPRKRRRHSLPAGVGFQDVPAPVMVFPPEDIMLTPAPSPLPAPKPALAPPTPPTVSPGPVPGPAPANAEPAQPWHWSPIPSLMLLPFWGAPKPPPDIVAQNRANAAALRKLMGNSFGLGWAF